MVSNKNADGGRKRPYRLKARAQRQEEVHRRITEITVDLHKSLGPARTTVSEIAKRAGVQRATVYNHFPTELDLIDACSSHWVSEHPPPDPGAWMEIEDPGRRAETVLAAMYDYYESGQDMLENVLRDAPLLPALEEINRRKWWPMIDGLVELLSTGWLASATRTQARYDGTRREPKDDQTETDIPRLHLDATIRVALDFFTWKTLSTTGLSNQQAARIAADWIRASAGTLDG